MPCCIPAYMFIGIILGCPDADVLPVSTESEIRHVAINKGRFCNTIASVV